MVMVMAITRRERAWGGRETLEGAGGIP